MSSSVNDFFSFIEQSPTSWHCVETVCDRLLTKGFEILEEQKTWNLVSGGKYIVKRGGSVSAFCLPTITPNQITILAAHTDSPAFKLKPNAIHTKQGMNFLNIEAYGAPIYHSWLNRDLALAGRCFVKNNDGTVRQELVFLEDMPFMIPELALHLHRDVNDKGPLVNVQEHLLPLLGSNTFCLESVLKKHLSFDSLLSFDLFIIPITPPRLLGTDKEYIASYRIDNLASVSAATTALTTYKDSSLLPMTVFWDHEEIGSTSWEGAQSSFLEDILRRIRRFYAMSKEDFLILKNNSLCLSIDMAHALHPLHAQKHDPDHAPLLGKGIVFKQNANLRYATCAYSLQKAVQIAQKAGLCFQHFATRSDLPCGSTVGPTTSAKLGIPTVDLGCAQLSMHSCREMMSVKDYLDSIVFFSQALKPL